MTKLLIIQMRTLEYLKGSKEREMEAIFHKYIAISLPLALLGDD
jgi:hypothetical protein